MSQRKRGYAGKLQHQQKGKKEKKKSLKSLNSDTENRDNCMLCLSFVEQELLLHDNQKLFSSASKEIKSMFRSSLTMQSDRCPVLQHKTQNGPKYQQLTDLAFDQFFLFCFGLRHKRTPESKISRVNKVFVRHQTDSGRILEIGLVFHAPSSFCNKWQRQTPGFYFPWVRTSQTSSVFRWGRKNPACCNTDLGEVSLTTITEMKKKWAREKTLPKHLSM